jgi:chemotaxis protein histidine kinase CheA/CheY-like chemotaxis protein
MPHSEAIAFHQFYMIDFFDKVREMAHGRIPDEHHRMLGKLGDYLVRYKDVVEGLEIIAREQGTSELSMFLFDVIERIYEQNPFVSYARLDGIADDFISTVQLILEEEENFEDLQKAVFNYSRKFGDPVEDERTKDFEEEIETEADSEEVINFEQYVLREFLEKLSDRISAEYDDEQSDLLMEFTGLLEQELVSDPEFDAPAPLLSMLDVMRTLFPWQTGRDYNPGQVSEFLTEAVDIFSENLVRLDQEAAGIITETVSAEKLAAPEDMQPVTAEPVQTEPAKPDTPQPVAEEIGDTTIESLLMDYFRTEVREQITDMHKIITSYEDNPEDPTVYKDLASVCVSFKEISMIHGYTGIEDLCSDLAKIFSSAHRKHQVLNLEVTSELTTILGQMSQPDQLVTGNRELKKLAKQVDDLKKIVASAPTVGTPVTHEPEPESEPLLGFDDAQKVFADLLSDLRQGAFDPDDPGKLTSTIDQLITAAKLMTHEALNNFLNLYRAQTEELSELEQSRKAEAIAELAAFYDEFQQRFAAGEDLSDLYAKLDGFTLKHEPEIPFADKDAIARILGDIEQANFEQFDQILNQVFQDGNADTAEMQVAHFSLLEQNLTLAGLDPLQPLAQTFKGLFELAGLRQFAADLLPEFRETYRLMLEQVANHGASADLAEITSVFAELIQGETEPEPQMVPEQQEEEASEVIPEESEEDLQVVFRQESLNYLDRVADALQTDDQGNLITERLEEAEKNSHSLKASARLMQFDAIAKVAAQLESLFEQARQPENSIAEGGAEILQNATAGLRAHISGEEIATADLIEQLGKVSFVKTVVHDELPEVDEAPLFREKDIDADEDMLQIFKDESEEFIEIIRNALTALQADSSNRESVNQLEYASHSMKSAAKMLGFREIGQIADGIEKIAEQVSRGNIEIGDAGTTAISDAVVVIERLSAGEKIQADQINDLIRALDVKQLEKQAKSKGKKRSKKSTREEVPELDAMSTMFLKEALEVLGQMNRDLVKLEKQPADLELMASLSRNVHTLKGSAQMMHFDKIGLIAHRIEDLFDLKTEAKESVTPEIIDLVYQSVDEIQAMIDSVRDGKGEESDKYLSLVLKINKLLGISDLATLPVEKPDPGQEVKIIEIEKTPVAARESEQFIKVTTDRLDRLINMAAELLINKTQLTNSLDTLKKLGEQLEKDKKTLRTTNLTLDDLLERRKMEGRNEPDESVGVLDDFSEAEFDRFNEMDTVARDFRDVLHTIDSITTGFNSLTQNFEQKIGRISNLTKLLHDDILQVRMVPVENLFNRFPRAVRDLAHKQGKKVSLIVEGEGTEMDRAMIESLSDPIMHIIRNAIDHGIETPDDRKTAGKEPDGILLLKARQDKNQIILEIQDDGRGIDMDRVRKTIVKNKLATKAEVEKFSTGEILDFIFNPGFTTRESADEISGRGVGLDVVASQLQKLKGDIRVSSTAGKGTVFSIRVPLTLIISQAMLIEVAGEILAVPLLPVEESVQYEETQIIQQGERDYLPVRDKLIPLADMRKMLNYRKAETKKGSSRTAIIIQEAGARYGLTVDRVIRREEIVIKSLGEHLRGIDLISGGTILGDGTVVLILDTSAIARRMETEMFGSQRDFSSLDKARKLLVEKEEKQTEYQRKLDELKEESSDLQPIEPKKVTGRRPAALVVDDSISVRKFVASVLERNDYDTVTASDGQDALEELTKHDFDIVVTDLEMPKMHGFDLIREIRKQDQYKGLPIVILTGRAGQKHRDTGMSLGANAFIVKPFKEIDLLNSLHKFIQTAED